MTETAGLTNLKVIVALGRIGSDAAWRLLGERGMLAEPKPLFGHGLVYRSSGPAVVGSFHPSRQNTNPNKLTPPMLEPVFRAAAAIAATELATDQRGSHG